VKTIFAGARYFEIILAGKQRVYNFAVIFMFADDCNTDHFMLPCKTRIIIKYWFKFPVAMNIYD